MQFDTLVAALSTTHKLSLPLGIAADAAYETKLRRGLLETAGRAVEVLEVQAESLPDGNGDVRRGRTFGEGIRTVLEALRASQMASLSDSETEKRTYVWEEGVARVLSFVRRGEWCDRVHERG
jgi:hypothetical protein